MAIISIKVTLEGLLVSLFVFLFKNAVNYLKSLIFVVNSGTSTRVM